MGATNRKIRETHLYLPGELPPDSQPLFTARRDPRCSATGINKNRGGAVLAAFDVDNAGIDELHQDYLNGTDHASTHLLYFIVEGAVWGISQDFQQKMSPGDLFLAPVGHGAWIELTEGSAKAVWIHLLDTPRWNFLKHQPANVHPAQYVKGIGSVMELLLREQALNRPGCETVIHHYEEILILYLLQETRDWGSPAERLARQQLLHLRGQLIERLAEEWTVEQMAAVCHMSAGHLHLLTKRHENHTPMELLRHLRMEHAATLLMSTTQTIDMIAQQVGYRTPYAFSDAFQRHTGKRPGAYRAAK